MTRRKTNNETLNFRPYVGSATRFRFQLRGEFFPLDGVIEAATRDTVCVRHQGGRKWLVTNRNHPQFKIHSIDILGEVV